MTAELERGLAILELLAEEPKGLSPQRLGAILSATLSVTKRALEKLRELGYVNVEPNSGLYVLSLKSASGALRYLSTVPLPVLARPLLNTLAHESGEHVRLAVVDQGRLVRVAQSQGSVAGLRYDPNHEGVIKLSCAASGYVWLASLDRSEAIYLLEQAGFARSGEYGRRAPRNIDDAMVLLERTRSLGYCYVASAYETGIATIAYPVNGTDGQTSAVLTIDGPETRFSERDALLLLPLLDHVATQLSCLRPLESLQLYSNASL